MEPSQKGGLALHFTMKSYRFGIVGSGFMGRTHAEAVKRLGPAAAVTAVWGGQRAAALAQDYGCACVPTLEELLQRSDVDAVVVTTPHHLHAEQALAALAAGKHVLIEKPITTSVADCDRLIAAASRRNLVVATGYHQRFRQNNHRTQRLIAENAIGQVQTLQVSMPTFLGTIQKGGFGGNWAWWDDPASLGHMINAFPHALDLMRWWLDSNPSTVAAFCRTFLPGLKVEDTTLALVEFSNGSVASIVSSRAFPAPPFPGENFRFRIMGSTGLIDLDPLGQLRLADEKGWRLVCEQPTVGAEAANTAFADTRMQAFRDQIASFIDAMEGRKTPADRPVVGSAQDGRVAVEACLAMLAGSRERRWVSLGR